MVVRRFPFVFQKEALWHKFLVYLNQRWCCESAAVNMPANLENSAVATGLEKVSFHSNPKEGNATEYSHYLTVALISHASKVMLKILQARLQQFLNWELPGVQAWVWKRQRDQRSSCHLLDCGESKKIPEKHLFLLYWLQ